MASIPNNGYAAVMAGTNVYTGSNFYGSDCPKAPIVPVDSDDLCNKLYVDAIVGGGTVVSVNAGNNISITGTAPAPIVNLQNPLTATLALGTQNLTAVNGLFSSTVNAQGLLNAQYLDAGVADATAQLLTAVGGDAILGLASNNLVTGNGHLLEVSANNAGDALIQHQTIGAPARNLAISSQGNITVNTTAVVSTSGSFKPATILDTFANGAGTAGQVLSSLGGAGTKWITSGGGGAGTLDQTLALGNTATGTYANITLTDTAAGGITNPILTLNNTEATNASVAMEVFKDKGSAGTAGDILFNQSVYGKDAGNAKQEYTRITHSIRDNTATLEDGSIEFACVRQGNMETFLQIQGVENEVNFQKPIDMVGNNIRSSTGSMTLTTALSTGLGNLIATAKAGVQIAASNGVVSTTATTGISSSTSTGNYDVTATAGNVNITSAVAGSTVLGGGQTTINGVGCNFSVGVVAGIQTGQLPTPARSILRTGHTTAEGKFLDYYPTVVVENIGSNTNVSLPYFPYQNLMLINSGISPTFSWSDTGDVIPAAPNSAMARASSGQYWVGAAGFIYVYSGANFLNPPFATFDIGVAGVVNVFYETGGFMFVGGLFTGVTGNPQPQFSLLRFGGASIGTPVEDPMFSAANVDEGFAGPVNAITSDGTFLYVGGLFAATVGVGPPTPLDNLCIISSPFAAAGSQTYTNDIQLGFPNFDTNGEVFSMLCSGSNIYVGGNFTTVAAGFQSISYAAYYTIGWTTTPWGTIGQGNFNNPIYSMAPAIDGLHLMFTGDFNFTENSQVIKYGGYIELANPINPCLPFGIATLDVSTRLNSININGGLNFLITNNRETWFGQDINAWESAGEAYPATGLPSGIVYEGGNIYVAIDTHTNIRLGIPLTASANFILPSQGFKTQAGTFSTATIPEYAAQLFVADTNGTYWHVVGTSIASFSP